MNKIAFLEGYLMKEAAGGGAITDYLAGFTRANRKLAKDWGLTNEILHSVNNKSHRTKAMKTAIEDYLSSIGYDPKIHKGIDLKSVGDKNLTGHEYLMDYIKKINPLFESNKLTADAATELARPGALTTYGIPAGALAAGGGLGYAAANA